MTATSITAPVSGRSHAVVLVLNADLSRTVGLIEGLGHLQAGTIAPTVETITLVYPGAMLPLWTTVDFVSGPGPIPHGRPNHLIHPKKDINSAVYLSEALFERLCGLISGMFCAMVPLSCTTLTIVGETEGLPDWSGGCPDRPIVTPSTTRLPSQANPRLPPGIMVPSFLDDARTNILPTSTPAGTEAPPPSVAQHDTSDTVDDSVSVISNFTLSDSPTNGSPRLTPAPIVALPNHPSEALLRQPLSEQGINQARSDANGADKENAQPGQIPAATDSDAADAEEVLQGVPCHQCGATVHVYHKRTWYAIIRGLEVGVRHTWKATRALVEHDRYNLSGIKHFAFHTRAEAEEKFMEELVKGNVKVLILSEVARPKK